MTKCNPHHWRIPRVGDDALECETCGRRLRFMSVSFRRLRHLGGNRLQPLGCGFHAFVGGFHAFVGGFHAFVGGFQYLRIPLDDCSETQKLGLDKRFKLSDAIIQTADSSLKRLNSLGCGLSDNSTKRVHESLHAPVQIMPVHRLSPPWGVVSLCDVVECVNGEYVVDVQLQSKFLPQIHSQTDRDVKPRL